MAAKMKLQEELIATYAQTRSHQSALCWLTTTRFVDVNLQKIMEVED